jgi:hypothetical protein
VDSTEERENPRESAAIELLQRSLEQGRDWPVALLEAMASWTVPSEVHEGRYYDYFIGGEAFDWLVLAERLGSTVAGAIPDDEWEDLLFEGRFPDRFDETEFKDLVGVEKYRGYLNFFYGVAVEEALQMATELEVRKRHLSNGNQYQGDFSDEVFNRIYRKSLEDLLQVFREELEPSNGTSMTLTESKEFTYWLFRYRLRVSDKAKVASDTRRGLEQMRSVISTARVSDDGFVSTLLGR